VSQVEEEDEGSSLMPGFTGALGSGARGLGRGFLAADKPLSERAGFRIPDLPGPVDEIGNVLIEESTRPTNLALLAAMIPTGGMSGIGFGANVFRGAATRLGVKAATSSPAIKAALRGAQGSMKVGEALMTAPFQNKFQSTGVRQALVGGEILGGRALGDVTADSIPEDAPTAFKVGGPIAATVIGSIAGARGVLSGARALGRQVDAEEAISALKLALRKKELVQAENYDAQALKELDEISQLIYKKEWEDLTDVERRSIRHHDDKFWRDFETASSDEFFGSDLDARLLIRRGLTKEQRSRVMDIVRNPKKPRSQIEHELDLDFRPTSYDDVRREAAYLRTIDSDHIRTTDEIHELIDEMNSTDTFPWIIAEDKFDDAGELIEKAGDLEMREWGDVPLFLGGEADAALLQGEAEFMKKALSGYFARRAIEIDEMFDRAVVDGISLKEAFVNGKFRDDLKAKYAVLTNDDRGFKFTEEAKAWEDVFQEIENDLRMLTDLDERAGVTTYEILGEDLKHLGKERLSYEEDWWFGDMFERYGDGDGYYFPRIVVRGEASGQGIQGAFGRMDAERQRIHGSDEGGATYIRRMIENAESMKKGDVAYLEDPGAILYTRAQASGDRAVGKWFSDAMRKQGLTVNDRIKQTPKWNMTLRGLEASQKTLRAATRRIVALEKKASQANIEFERTAASIDRLGGQSERSAARIAGAQTESSNELLRLSRQMIGSLEIAGMNRSHHASGATYRALVKANAKLERLTTRLAVGSPVDPDELSDVLETVDRLYRRSEGKIDTWLKTANEKQILEIEDQLGYSIGRAEGLRRVEFNAQVVNRQEGRSQILRSEINTMLRSLDRTNAKHTAYIEELEEILGSLDAQRQTLADAKLFYQQARAQASRLGPDEGHIDAFISGQRFYKSGFADSMNEYLSTNKDLLPYIGSFNNFARALNATMDLSAIGIQGLLAIGVDPIRAARIIIMTTAALKDPKFYNQYVVSKHDVITSMIKDGVYWAPLSDAGEFLFPSKITRIPFGVGKAVEAANFHFSRTGNLLRLMLYERGMAEASFLNRITGRGTMRGAVGEANRKELAEQINNATGFRSENPSSLTSAIMFAPRYFGSQLNLLRNAAIKDNAEGRMARDLLMRTLTAGVVTTWFLNSVQGEETEFNPIRYDAEGKPHYNTNFLRIRLPSGDDVSLFGSWDSLMGLIMTGITEGPASSSAKLFRTKASPAVNVMADLMLQETFQGDPVNFLTDDPRVLGMSALRLGLGRLPFTLQNTVDMGMDGLSPTQIALGTAMNATGIKAARQTPRERRDLRSIAEYDKEWASLTKTEKLAIEEMYPELTREIDEQLLTRAENGDIEAQARVQKQEIDVMKYEAERALAVAVANGDIDRKDFAKHFKDIKLRASLTKKAKDITSYDWAESDDPNLRAVNGYFEILENDELKTFPEMGAYSPLDWERADPLLQNYLSTLTDGERAFIDDYFALHLKDHPPEIHTFLRAQEYVNDSDYWAVQEHVFEDYRRRVENITNTPIRSYNEMEKFMRKTGSRGELVRLETIRKFIDKDVKRDREQMRRRNPALDEALVYSRGYKALTTAGRRLARDLGM